MILVARDIVNRIENELEYPDRLRFLIRESRAIDSQNNNGKNHLTAVWQLRWFFVLCINIQFIFFIMKYRANSLLHATSKHLSFWTTSEVL